MSKKHQLVVIVFLSLLTMFVVNAGAAPPRSGGTIWTINGLYGELYLYAVQDEDSRFETSAKVTVDLNQVYLWWLNPTGKTGGEPSDNYQVNTSITANQNYSDFSIDENGKITVKVDFSTDSIIGSIYNDEELIDSLRPNDKWEIDDALVLSFWAEWNIYQEISSDCEDNFDNENYTEAYCDNGHELVLQVSSYCELSDDGYNFSCSDGVWRWKKNDPTPD